MEIAHPLAETLMPPPSDWIVGYAGQSDAVRAFCLRHSILCEAETAVRIAKECFNPIEVKLQIEDDPEGEGEWLAIDVIVNGTIDEVLAAYNRYLDRWIVAAPVDKLEYIRLDYNFA